MRPLLLTFLPMGSQMLHTPVLIIGAGPVGLALACELGWRGVGCTLIEQGDGTVEVSKANELSIRTMEHCRRWGIARTIRECPFPSDFALDVAYVTSLCGYELARIKRPARSAGALGPHSPECMQVCPQIWFDPILQNLARALPAVELRFRTRLESFEQTSDGITAQLYELDTERHCSLQADYLVGCDGAGSSVRRQLGIGLGGRGVLSHALSLSFRAPDLLAKCGIEPGLFFHAVDRGGLWANIRAIDPARSVWRLMVNDTGARQSLDMIDRAALLRRALGFDLGVEWLASHVWTRRSAVGDRFQHGRVFLAGDAIHQFSPTGAQGMNTGIGDAVDLGWKLAAVIDGWGGEQLLTSYESERLPIGLRNVAATTDYFLDHRKFADGLDEIEDDSPTGQALRRKIGEVLMRNVGRTFQTVGIELGYRYEDSPICVPDATPPEPDEPARYMPSTRPGARAPHAWLPDGRSMLDLYGRGFLLLRLGEDAPDPISFEIAAAACGIPLSVMKIVEPDIVRIYERRLVLVRPDGHVAWRGNDAPDDPSAVIDKVRGVATRSQVTLPQPARGLN